MIDDGDVTRTGVADGADALAPVLEPRRVVAPLQYRDPDRYTILGEHGRGGIGRVQRAHDKELSRGVAIKELIRRGDIGEVRFLREAMITARLEHPGIVPVHEAGRWPDGTPFYVMKLVAGRSLKELLDERHTIDSRIGLLHHVIAVADAVAYAHKRGIIHRDLKPANVIAGDFGETVVIDWGLAKDLYASQEPDPEDGPYRRPATRDLTVAGSIVGTPRYMSPEQARGEYVDQRTDVFAIGAMLWQLCSLSSVPPPLQSERVRMLRAARIDRDLIAIITKALAHDPDARYRSAGELAADLKAFKSGARIAARDYSLFAMLAHWIRQRRMMAVTVGIATVLALAGTVLYVRNIAVERDRAEKQRIIAASERDHAQLAEASALLDKDPTRARRVLDGLTLHTPEYALLRARASHGAAVHVFSVPGGIARLVRHPRTSQIAFASNMGDLMTVDLERGELHLLDHDVPDLLAPVDDGWVYARMPTGAKSATVATTRSAETINVGSLFSDNESRLLAAAGSSYALDHGRLYRIDRTGLTLVRDHVNRIASSNHVLMICTIAGELEVMRDGTFERRTRCVADDSNWPMAATDNGYAALLDRDTLLVVRDGKSLELPTHIAGEYEVALADSGLVGLAELEGKPWFVRPGGERLEPGPAGAGHLLSVAADGDVVAWGFDDGVAIALDTRTGQVWRFIGQGAPISQLAVDARRARLFTIGGAELRVWALPPSRVAVVDHLPCIAFNAARSRDGKRIALDCSDGAVREWTLQDNAVRVVHRHEGVAYGVAWLGESICSGGFNGGVLCTTDANTRELVPTGPRVRRMVLGPPGSLVMSTDDGNVGPVGAAPFYNQRAIPYALAFNSDGTRLASGGFDGSLIVYDVATRTTRTTTGAHAGLVTAVAWRGDEVWTSGQDGAIKRWRVTPSSLERVQTFDEPRSSRFLHLYADGWSAITGGRVLVVTRASESLRLDLDRNVERCEVSEDERYIATSTATEVIVVDLVGHRVASVPVSSRGGYVGFARPGFLVISNASGLMTVSLESLEFISYASSPKH